MSEASWARPRAVEGYDTADFRGGSRAGSAASSGDVDDVPANRASGVFRIGAPRFPFDAADAVADEAPPVLSPSASVRARPLPRRPPSDVFPTLGRTTGRRRATG